MTEVAWSRVFVLERQEWIAKRSSWVPSDVRNVKQHTEQYWATPGDPRFGAPGASGMPSAGVSPANTELRTRTYFTYEIQEWRRGRSLTAGGTGPADVRWPDEVLVPGERIRSRSETYTAVFTADGKRYQADLPEPEWRALEPGSACRLTLGLLGGVKKATPEGR